MVTRLMALTALVGLLASLALLVSLHQDVRQTQQLLRTLVVQGEQATHLGFQAHINAVTIIKQLHEQAALLGVTPTPLSDDRPPAGPRYRLPRVASEQE